MNLCGTFLDSGKTISFSTARLILTNGEPLEMWRRNNYQPARRLGGYTARIVDELGKTRTAHKTVLALTRAPQGEKGARLIDECDETVSRHAALPLWNGK